MKKGNSESPKQVILYADAQGREPFTEWLYESRDSEGRNRILARLRRIEQGNYGDYKNLTGGVYELRIDCGPGYRVYFGQDKDIIILLCGGNKSSQSQDIVIAKGYWKEYLDNAKNENS